MIEGNFSPDFQLNPPNSGQLKYEILRTFHWQGHESENCWQSAFFWSGYRSWDTFNSRWCHNRDNNTTIQTITILPQKGRFQQHTTLYNWIWGSCVLSYSTSQPYLLIYYVVGLCTTSTILFFSLTSNPTTNGLHLIISNKCRTPNFILLRSIYRLDSIDHESYSSVVLWTCLHLEFLNNNWAFYNLFANLCSLLFLTIFRAMVISHNCIKYNKKGT